MRAIALEVITRAVFGVEDEQHRVRLERALSRLLDAATRPLRLFVLLLLAPDGPTVRAWRQHAPTIGTVDALLRDEIRRRRAEQASGREDILSLLLLARDQDGRPLSDEHLRDELMTLLVAGHETTAAALAWAFERLARRPEAFERLAGEEGDEYANAVAKETLRVRPVIPFVVRQLSAPVTLAGCSPVQIALSQRPGRQKGRALRRLLFSERPTIRRRHGEYRVWLRWLATAGRPSEQNDSAEASAAQEGQTGGRRETSIPPAPTRRARTLFARRSMIPRKRAVTPLPPTASAKPAYDSD